MNVAGDPVAGREDIVEPHETVGRHRAEYGSPAPTHAAPTRAARRPPAAKG